MDGFIEHMKKIQQEATRASEAIEQDVAGRESSGLLAKKTRFQRTVIMPDDESAKEVAEDPKMQNMAQILDNFSKKVRG